MELRSMGLPADCGLCVAPTACARVSPVVPIGNGAYEIAGQSATALTSGSGEKLKIIAAANTYCSKQGKQAVVVQANDRDGRVGGFANLSGNSYEMSGG